MDERERMVAGLPYRAWKDGLPEARLQMCIRDRNTTSPTPAPV